MRRRIRTNVAWLLLVSILLVNLPLLPASAQRLLPVEQHASAVKLAAKYMAGGLGLPDNLLERCGYRPAVGAAAWAHYPPARKIEDAYHAAERHARGGGEVLLALLAQELARRYESAANDPLLRGLLAGGEVKGCPSFDTTPTHHRPKLSRRHRAIVNRLASYCGGAATGYIAATVARYFDIPFDASNAIFTRGGYDLETGLHKALALVPRNLRDSKARALVEYIASHNESVRRDPLLHSLTQSAAYRPEPEQKVAASQQQTVTPETSRKTRPRTVTRPTEHPASSQGLVSSELPGLPVTSAETQLEWSEPVEDYAVSEPFRPAPAPDYSFGVGLPWLEAPRVPSYDLYSAGRYWSPVTLPQNGLTLPGAVSPRSPLGLTETLRRGDAPGRLDLHRRGGPLPAELSPALRDFLRKHPAAPSPGPQLQTAAPVPAPDRLTYYQRLLDRIRQDTRPAPAAPPANAAPVRPHVTRAPAPARGAAPQPRAGQPQECDDGPKRP